MLSSDDRTASVIQRRHRPSFRKSPRVGKRERRLARSRSINLACKLTFGRQDHPTDRGLKMVSWSDSFGFQERFVWKP